LEKNASVASIILAWELRVLVWFPRKRVQECQPLSRWRMRDVLIEPEQTQMANIKQTLIDLIV